MTSLDTTDEIFTDDLRQRQAHERERRCLEKWSLYRYGLTLAELDDPAMELRHAKEDAEDRAGPKRASDSDVRRLIAARGVTWPDQAA